MGREKERLGRRNRRVRGGKKCNGGKVDKKWRENW